MNGLFLSIDFEDFAHDLKRDLGIWETGPLRTAALQRAYEQIEAFLQAHGGARITFFCTGILAQKAPELIARIAEDGHEIACHYHYHDCIDEETPDSFEANLLTGLEHLRAASGQRVQGFRAPKFRINQTTPEQFRILGRHMLYDSSYLAQSAQMAQDFTRQVGNLKILPIYSGKIAPKTPALRLGGTYMKMFPSAVTRKLISQAQQAGLRPHIYLHPYEFVSDNSFALSRDELAPLGARKAAYWHARQNQWHRIGNRGLPKKLSRLVSELGLGGRLDENLLQLAAS